ncbi:MAG: hypothetical protein GEV10_06265 [Streptosporangiales bacterium]|nr:hypothetical protein [Streptosporangiales bacterium]
MFEWHGWATIRTTPEVVDFEDSATGDTVQAVARLVEGAQGIVNETVDLRWANGDLHLWVAGAHNHEGPRQLELYQAVAQAAPGSYGVLYTFDHDDEHWKRYVMRRGDVRLEVDESLSPHVPMVEDEDTDD